jgi:hypothetical protein
MEREIDVATFAPNADGVELKHRSPAGLGEAAARADRGADPPTCALYSPADLPVGTRRRRGPYEDHGVAALYSPADLPAGTRRRRGPFEDHGVAALYIHPPTYRWEPDGAVDLLRMTAYLTLKLLD